MCLQTTWMSSGDLDMNTTDLSLHQDEDVKANIFFPVISPKENKIIINSELFFLSENKKKIKLL